MPRQEPCPASAWFRKPAGSPWSPVDLLAKGLISADIFKGQMELVLCVINRSIQKRGDGLELAGCKVLLPHKSAQRALPPAACGGAPE